MNDLHRQKTLVYDVIPPHLVHHTLTLLGLAPDSEEVAASEYKALEQRLKKIDHLLPEARVIAQQTAHICDAACMSVLACGGCGACETCGVTMMLRALREELGNLIARGLLLALADRGYLKDPDRDTDRHSEKDTDRDIEREAE